MVGGCGETAGAGNCVAVRVLKWQPKALVKSHIMVTINASFGGQGNKATCLLLWKIYLVANRSFLTFRVF